ncbi:MAG: nuclear transport factor 2 family protein [Acidobacteria bacterium]|jgi:hypothetical protein|nr:nuclear transport factor 2 family protein [Acidobacteriota bacterium]
MKRLFAALLLLAAAVAPAAAAGLQDDLLAREKALWTAWGEKQGAPTRAQTVEDYVQVVAGVGMTAGREAVASAIEKHTCVMKSFTFQDARLRQPAPDVAILTYVANQDTTCDGQALPGKVFATSIWVRQGGNWVGYSYQETPID